jgi:hypothetical protein
LEGKFQNFIAAAFRLSRATWTKLMGKGKDETALRIAFERGQAVHEQDIASRLLAAGVRFTPALMSYTKAKLGWREAEPIVSNNENRIQIVLPAPTTREEMFKRLNLTGPLDFRRDKSVPHPMLKDVTPQPKALPAPSGEQPLPPIEAEPERDSPDVTNMQAATVAWAKERAEQHVAPLDAYAIEQIQNERTAQRMRDLDQLRQVGAALGSGQSIKAES